MRNPPRDMTLLGFRISPEISFGHLLQLLLILASAIALALGGQKWVTSVEYEIKSLGKVVIEENHQINQLDQKYERIDERLSRVEGTVDSISKAVK